MELALEFHPDARLAIFSGLLLASIKFLRYFTLKNICHLFHLESSPVSYVC